MSAGYYDLFIVGCIISALLVLFIRKRKKMCSIVKVLIYIFIICFIVISMFSLFEGNNIIELGYGFHYNEELLAIMSDYLNLPDIPSEVLMYQHDDSFIIAKQKPRRYKEFNYTYNEGYKYSKGLDSEYYWIIKKKEKKVFGPLEYSQFIRLCDEFYVPENLRLN
jgi:hypothetical protein